MGPTGKGRGSWQFRVVQSRGLELSLGSEKEQVEERASSDIRDRNSWVFGWVWTGGQFWDLESRDNLVPLVEMEDSGGDRGWSTIPVCLAWRGFLEARTSSLKTKTSALLAQLSPTLCDSMDCSLPGLSVHEIFQTRILECVAISYSRWSSWPRGRTHVSCVSCIAGRFFTILSHLGILRPRHSQSKVPTRVGHSKGETGFAFIK